MYPPTMSWPRKHQSLGTKKTLSLGIQDFDQDFRCLFASKAEIPQGQNFNILSPIEIPFLRLPLDTPSVP